VGVAIVIPSDAVPARSGIGNGFETIDDAADAAGDEMDLSTFRMLLAHVTIESSDAGVRADAAARLADLTAGGDDRADHGVNARRSFLQSVLTTCSNSVIRKAAAAGIVDLSDDSGASDELKAQRVRELLA
jgi:hypothetical protein